MGVKTLLFLIIGQKTKSFFTLYRQRLHQDAVG